MPHLSLNGLSENWLLKECGHRHWHMLASAAGMDSPDFRDTSGNQIYAVFRAVSISSARFDVVAENDIVHFQSTISQISRTQFESRHILTCRGLEIAEIKMISSFVKRGRDGTNRSVIRVNVDAFPFIEKSKTSAFSDTATHFARDLWDQHLWFRREDANGEQSFVVRPNPSLDFNGARFLYFASFAAIVDRIEWENLAIPISAVTTRRDIFFYGNIEPGEAVRISICGIRRSEDELTHWCTLYSESEKRKLADVFTCRQISPTQNP